MLNNDDEIELYLQDVEAEAEAGVDALDNLQTLLLSLNITNKHYLMPFSFYDVQVTYYIAFAKRIKVDE